MPTRISPIALALALGLGLGLLGVASDVQAGELRFSATTRGGLAITGNTLGLSKALGENGPGTRDAIGTFIAADTGSVDATPPNPPNPWPAGTTASWLANGSSAELDLPAGHSVLFAELIWGGSYDYAPEDVSASLDAAVTLGFGPSDSTSLAPSAATSVTLALQSSTGFPVNYYVRSGEVTDFVAAHGSGTYSASGVPATQSELNNSLNAAGWTLVVAYSDLAAPWQYLAVVVGGDWIDEDSSATVDFGGFTTPAGRGSAGRLLLSAIEGDASQTADEVLFEEGAVASGFDVLSGPNNPPDNFFASQLNDEDGLLDPRGRFGGVNHAAASAQNVSGARQGWDVTTVALSDADGHLSPNLSTARVRAATAGDSYVLTLVALQVDTVPEPGLQAGVATAVATLVALRRRVRRRGQRRIAASSPLR